MPGAEVSRWAGTAGSMAFRAASCATWDYPSHGRAPSSRNTTARSPRSPPSRPPERVPERGAATMKATVCTRWGPPEVLQLAEVARPVPRKGEVRIRIVATAVTASDCIARALRAPARYRILARLVMGWSGPRRPIFGMVFWGVAALAGRTVRSFRPGDQVFGLSRWKAGCYAEYACYSANGIIAAKPANLSHDEAAALAHGGPLGPPTLEKGGVPPG